MYDIIEKLKREIEGFKDDPEWENVGRVVEVGDGIVKLTGLKNAVSQELLMIETKEGPRRAVALNLEEGAIGALVLDDYIAIEAGATVRGTGDVLALDVSPEMVGRVVDALGNPLDGKGPIIAPSRGGSASGRRMTLENNAPSVLERESVSVPLHTGIKSIDAMIPIGRGQRELIIGDRQQEKPPSP